MFELDYNNRFSINSFARTGTFISNFDKSERQFFEMTIREFPNLDLQISDIAYDCNKRLINNYCSLHAAKTVTDLSNFWESFWKNKEYNVESDVILNSEILLEG